MLRLGSASSLAACVAALTTFAPAQEPSAKRPLNFIVLLVDDWGWRDAGCCGSDLFQTPNIDRLARDGMRFTQGYAACTVCSPTRAALLTGKYPARTRVTDWIPGHRRGKAKLAVPDWTQKLEHEHVTVAEALKARGYRTAHIGKWHLTPRSPKPDVVAPYYPEKHGFDINVAGNQWGAPGSYHFPYRRRRGPKDGLNARVANFPKGGKPGDYLTDTLTDQAVRVLGEMKDDPFFLYFAYYTVHTPIQGRKDLVARYKSVLADGKRRQHRNPSYAAMVTALDESVGRIRKRVQELGIADRTVIVLTGDNGGLDRNGRITDNAPLRAGKGSAYEGGVRVPFIAQGPKIAPGTTCDAPVTSVDLMPTILQLAGAKQPPKDVDGESLAPLLADPDAKLQRDAIFWHYPHYHPGGATPYGAIRMGRWRLVEFFEDGRVELYDLEKDIGERHDLAATQPELRQRLHARLRAWRREVGAQMPKPKSP